MAYQGSEAEKKFTLSGEAYVAGRRAASSASDWSSTCAMCSGWPMTWSMQLWLPAPMMWWMPWHGLKAVAKVRPSSDFESISVAFKRMKNILRQAAETKKAVAEPFNPSALKDAEEKKLADAVPGVAKKVKELSASRQYEPALIEISRLRPAIDAFFDKVMVMVEDENLRANGWACCKHW